jgi:hypothetical protein
MPSNSFICRVWDDNLLSELQTELLAELNDISPGESVSPFKKTLVSSFLQKFFNSVREDMQSKEVFGLIFHSEFHVDSSGQYYLDYKSNDFNIKQSRKRGWIVNPLKVYIIKVHVRYITLNVY